MQPQSRNAFRDITNSTVPADSHRFTPTKRMRDPTTTAPCNKNPKVQSWDLEVEAGRARVRSKADAIVAQIVSGPSSRYPGAREGWEVEEQNGLSSYASSSSTIYSSSGKACNRQGLYGTFRKRNGKSVFIPFPVDPNTDTACSTRTAGLESAASSSTVEGCGAVPSSHAATFCNPSLPAAASEVSSSERVKSASQELVCHKLKQERTLLKSSVSEALDQIVAIASASAPQKKHCQTAQSCEAEDIALDPGRTGATGLLSSSSTVTTYSSSKHIFP
ncbi:hypothetical protein GUITHDRAFT_133348 [Guillardia theta CCMP2712]|uniref:Uncharacterized protein n=1 Tax=Guillardia theta (strain CCMP2712) TaxID=905079 RepID=L1JXX5_GUITC|nr:hypothetical protein GUITHDRAFT_133348 [Guillardia theta CCMP2712]EKX52943.1 hypothetical protein GUITHDRAFT_133348 [Guillardia theta CCMP2712]|eukprot:XP_005839923.1 hypothetical protein GUITHDRAFT_133348 [Guillardia theta CCMP2712]